ncbi:MAG: metal-dependent transcriptional regulator [Candidatus Hydrothermarchaeaceae archaeon]
MEGKCLKTLYGKGHTSRTKTGEIARGLGIPGSTATDLVRRMEAKGLVTHEKYYGVSLTPNGRARAEEIFRHHRLLEFLLVEELALSAEDACVASGRMDEHLPKDVADVICMKYSHPDTCPCGKELLPSSECCPG